MNEAANIDVENKWFPNRKMVSIDGGFPTSTARQYILETTRQLNS
jgi:hypothetical protein